jgi:hypothetical protein
LRRAGIPVLRAATGIPSFSFGRKDMALNAEQLKAMITGEYETSAFSDDIDTLWPLWVERTGGDELQLRKRLLVFLQGRYRTRYNVTNGRDRREAKQLFDMVTSMFAAVETDIATDNPAAGVPYLRSVQMVPVKIFQDCYTEDEAYLSGKYRECV